MFKNLSLEARAGECIAVTGPNGSGKSTLLRIIAGLMRPDEGIVRLTENARPVSDEDRPYMVGFVAPYFNVYDAFTARENLEFIARLRGIKRGSPAIDEVLDRVSLKQRADDFVWTFSTGMKQRIRYAAALLPGPVLLLLDEPSSNLDEAGLEMVQAIENRHRDNGGLTIVATNDSREASRCDRNVRIEEFCHA